VSVDGGAMLGAAGMWSQRRGGLMLVAVATALMGVAGCGGHSAASEASVARSVPVPPGVTFASIDDQTDPQLVGPVTHEANAAYTNPPMQCSQLLDEWLSALRAAHWAVDNSKTTLSQIFAKHGGYSVIVGLDNVTTCKQTIVGVR